MGNRRPDLRFLGNQVRRVRERPGGGGGAQEDWVRGELSLEHVKFEDP